MIGPALVEVKQLDGRQRFEVCRLTGPFSGWREEYGTRHEAQTRVEEIRREMKEAHDSAYAAALADHTGPAVSPDTPKPPAESADVPGPASEDDANPEPPGVELFLSKIDSEDIPPGPKAIIRGLVEAAFHAGVERGRWLVAQEQGK